MVRLGIIGCGNMGGAMLGRILQSGVLEREEILVADHSPQIRERIREQWGVATTGDNTAAASAPCVLLAVKPQYMDQVGEEIAPCLKKDTLVLSIVMGYDLAGLSACLRRQAGPCVRIMPNTPAMVGEGVIALCRGEGVDDSQWRFAQTLMAPLGLVQAVPESWMDAVTGVSGSSPAFAFLFLEALADAGVRGGLPRETARKFAAQALLGSAKLALETGLHPGQLKDMVTSPGGTTIEGVAALEKNGFRFAVMDAVDAAIQKAAAVREGKGCGTQGEIT